MPTLIGFDTATDDTAVAAMRDGELLFSRSVERPGDGRPLHATRLLAEVEEGQECGIVLEGFADIKEEDMLEFFQTKKVEQTLQS